MKEKRFIASRNATEQLATVIMKGGRQKRINFAQNCASFPLTSGRFQQEAHMSNFQDQRKANRANSVHEGLAIGIIAIKCQGRYTCSKLGRKKWEDIL